MKLRLLIIFIMLKIGLAQDPITWTKHVISDSIEKAKKHVVADINQDGFMDVVCTANPEGSSGVEDPAKPNVLLYLNDGNQVFTEYVIAYKFLEARGIGVGDLNSDGFPDLAVGNRNYDSSLVWFENPTTGYNQEWARYPLGAGAPLNYEVHILDVNNDGIPDILDGYGDAADGGNSADDYIRWFENDGQASPAFTEYNIINYPTPSGIAVADFDGDSDLDICADSWLDYTNPVPVTDEDVRWWAQGTGNSWSLSEIIKTSYGGIGLDAADMDDDGDQDIIGAGWKAQTFDWWANDGSGNFGSSIHTIATGVSYPRHVAAADMDGDADMDVLTCADNDNTVAWFENDGSLNFTEHDLSTDFTYAYYVTPSDLDGDGDMDVVATAQDKIETGGTVAGQVAWWENDLSEERTIAAGDPAAESFNNAKVIIDFASGYSGGMTSVFFNHGRNRHTTQLEIGLDHIAAKGYYTIVSHASTYSATIDFYYSGISEWSNITNENDLRICYWDENSGANGEWVVLAPTAQQVFPADDFIRVSGISSELKKFSLFTLGSVSGDNPLPVRLVDAYAQINSDHIYLCWTTGSEVANLGFEIWRKKDGDSEYKRLTSYQTNNDLRGMGYSSAGRTYHYSDFDVISGQTYSYILYDVNLGGIKSEARRFNVDFIPSDISRLVDGALPTRLALANNFPNPFNATTNIEFSIPEKNSGDDILPVRVDIYNINGQRVRTLFEGELAPGKYRLVWDGKNDQGREVSSGNYVFGLRAGGKFLVRRMTLLK